MKNQQLKKLSEKIKKRILEKNSNMSKIFKINYFNFIVISSPFPMDDVIVRRLGFFLR